ncbi:MAG: HDIG domain-containing protein [Anaerolineae bacterium]
MLTRFFEQRSALESERISRYINRLVVSLAALLFLLVATLIVAFEDIFPSGSNQISTLEVNDIAPQSIYAPQNVTYISDILTEQQRDAARAAVRPIYELPNPLIARQQTQLARQILDYITNVRRDEFATSEQQVRDLHAITALVLDDAMLERILDISENEWTDIDNQVMTVLENVFQEEVRDTDVERIRSLLPNQVSVRFSDDESAIIVAIVSDLVRPNTQLDEEATALEREAAAARVLDQPRSFERGQIIVTGGERVTALDYEALDALGLLRPAERRSQSIAQAFVASLVVLVVTGLYLLRFRPSLIYDDLRMLSLLSTIFLIVLLGARLGIIGQIYIYPTAALALLYVAIVGQEIAIIGMLGLALLVGVMDSNALETATLVAAGGITGALTLRRSERLNSFFVAGLMVSIVNIAVAIVFNIDSPISNNPGQFALLITYAFTNGILTAAAALAAMYIVTFLFNLTTALKLSELSQPNQPLLQRLLREAPGTYQHTLQVANLSEQAANAIGANAELTRVGALYHDIGKMLNPAFFTENQRDIGNPHDALDDPYRSAEIIIDHVVEGDEMARQARLPTRIRDFIREHHGTTTVYVFYKQAVILADDDENQVDKAEFTYPGPRPQSRETAILMLADSCEAAVRSQQPRSKQEIEDIVQRVFDGKLRDNQMDDSGLTMNDVKTIQTVFVEILQGIFHPRINYSEAISKARKGSTRRATMEPSRKGETVEIPNRLPPETTSSPSRVNSVEVPRVVDHTANGDDDDSPLPEVPRLRRTRTENDQMES